MVWKTFSKIHLGFGLFMIPFFMVSCKSPSSVTGTSITKAAASTAAVTRFADGTKSVRINLVNTPGTYPSFSTAINTLPTTIASPTIAVPSGYPGYGSGITYNPGIAADTFYDTDGVTAISKPSWLTDFQVGVTDIPISVSGTTGCATFGGSASLDAANVFRVSEVNCTPAALALTSSAFTSSIGSGTTLDPIFVRIILNRDTTYIGANENLIMNIEYQASGLTPYLRNVAVAVNPNPETIVDQLWKVLWSSTLSGTTTMKAFSTFVPNNYSSCTNDIGTLPAPGKCSPVAYPSYTGSPVRTKQIILPLSAYSDMKVIQISRLHSFATDGAATRGDLATFCTVGAAAANSPLCLGVIIRSITLSRM